MRHGKGVRARGGMYPKDSPLWGHKEGRREGGKRKSIMVPSTRRKHCIIIGVG